MRGWFCAVAAATLFFCNLIQCIDGRASLAPKSRNFAVRFLRTSNSQVVRKVIDWSVRRRHRAPIGWLSGCGALGSTTTTVYKGKSTRYTREGVILKICRADVSLRAAKMDAASNPTRGKRKKKKIKSQHTKQILKCHSRLTCYHTARYLTFK